MERIQIHCAALKRQKPPRRRDGCRGGFFSFWGSKSYAFTRTGTSASAVSQSGGRGASGAPGKSGRPPAPRQGVLGPASSVRLVRAAPASGPPSCRHGERRQQRHGRSPRRKTQQRHKPGWRRKQFESGTYRFSSWGCRGSRRESLAMAGNLSALSCVRVLG